MNYDPTDPRTRAAADQLAATTRDAVPQLLAAVRDMLASANGDRVTVLGILTVHFTTQMAHNAVAGVAADALLRLVEAGEVVQS